MTKDASANESKYESRNPLKRYLLKKFIREITSLIYEIAPLTILDAGCGEGFIAQETLLNHPQIKFTGIDKNREAVRKAKTRVPRARFIPADLHKLPFDKNSFDLVLCLEVLEHLENPQKALSELFRVTRKTALISVPDEPLFSYLRLLTLSDVSKLGRHPEHINFWNKSAFPKFLKQKFSRVTLIKSLPWLICLAYK